MARPSELPDYRNPPIDEVALGLHFSPVSGFTDAHTGLFWQRIRSEYPTTQSRSRVDVPIEDLDETEVLSPPKPLSISFTSGPESRSGRTWFLSEDDATLLQVQDSQFLHNWRYRGSEYPHLDELIRRFWSAYDSFLSLLADESLTSPTLRQVELTYFNWIPDLKVASFFLPAAASAAALSDTDLTLENVVFVAPLVDSDATRPVARLTVECQPAFRVSGDDGIRGSRLVLSYKAPLRPDAQRDVIDDLFDRGRKAIVTTFTSLTTEDAQSAWGRFQ